MRVSRTSGCNPALTVRSKGLVGAGQIKSPGVGGASAVKPQAARIITISAAGRTAGLLRRLVICADYGLKANLVSAPVFGRTSRSASQVSLRPALDLAHQSNPQPRRSLPIRS